jgi:hypothetical protein
MLAVLQVVEIKGRRGRGGYGAGHAEEILLALK